jgi:hypothetical protein
MCSAAIRKGSNAKQKWKPKVKQIKWEINGLIIETKPWFKKKNSPGEIRIE